MSKSILVLPIVIVAAASAQPADLVLRNGKVVTMNSAAPVAQALAVRGDRIAALGSDADAPHGSDPAPASSTSTACLPSRD